MPAPFVHLHLHSEYSLVDSTIRIPELVAACAETGIAAVALTDQANVIALVKFCSAAERAGIKPIAGCDLLIDPGNVREPPSRLTVLCQDHAGYLTLSKLLTRAYERRAHGAQAFIDAAWLDDANAGLIALLGRESDVGRLAALQRDRDARASLERWHERFAGRLYLEITRTGRTGEDAFNASAIEFGAALGLPMVASNDVRFLARDDFAAHEARVCIQQGRVLADPRRPHDYSREQYLKSPAEMAALFEDLPEAVENTVELARRCNVEIALGNYHLPTFPLPAGDRAEDHIRAEARRGLEAKIARYPPAPGRVAADYTARLDHELDVIAKMGFSGYFLIVADFIRWAREHDIPVGPGRGSGAGSLVAWALGITDLDPLLHGLLFERFLNPERVSMPDFDVDFCMDRRDEVIHYVADKYGHDRVGQIITCGTMAAKAVLRDTGRVLGMPYGQVDRIAKLLPRTPLDLTLEDALGRSEKSHQESGRVVVEFKALYEADEEVAELVDLALKLEDLTRNAGKHAGGVVIAPGPISDFVPLYCEEGGHDLVTQFDKDDIEAIGLVKFDFLGLRTLTIIDWAVKAINACRGRNGEIPLDIGNLPTDDPATFALLKQCRTAAVFQLESRGMRDLVRKLQPDTFEDIVALNALYRPGPLQSGMVDDFIARKHGDAAATFPHPLLEPILAPTYGVIVYQEQVMQIAQVLAGYSLGGADLLRRAMGKKKPEEMARQRLTFEEGASARGVDVRLASAIFDLMEKFSGYGFNRSHAAAYALVAYQTAWLKCHHPAKFMAATLSADMDITDKVVASLAEARALGLAIAPPDVNTSDWMFVADDAAGGTGSPTIRYGLGAIRGVGRGAVDAILAARSTGGPFTNLGDFCRRVDAQRTNKRVFEALILSGAMDALAPTRSTLFAQLPDAVQAAERQARDLEAGQHDMFGAAAMPATIDAPPAVAEWPTSRRLAGERETLGYYLSGHPVDVWRDLAARVATSTIGAIDQHFHSRPPDRRGRPGEQPYTIVGLVASMRKVGDTMAFAQVEDGTGSLEVTLYRDVWVEFGPLLTRDAILLFEGGLAFNELMQGYQLRARSITAIDAICERQARLLRVRTNGIDADFVPRLQRVLAGYRGGDTPVRIIYRNAAGSADIDLGPQWRVRAGIALVRDLEGLDGVIAADLAYAPPGAPPVPTDA
ncbi:MAG: DNA polymerase III subunit alpha [Lysobacterales bacterium]